MKKDILNVLSIIVILALCVCSFSITGFAISDDCLYHHFYNLKEYYGNDGNKVDVTPPSVRSCSFTAISLLLTFYDSYWNDQFVYGNQGWTPGIYNSGTGELIRTFTAEHEAADWDLYINENNISNADLPSEYIGYA